MINLFLYDLGTDPGELYNIAEEHPDIVQELTMLANAHKASLKIAKSIFDQSKLYVYTIR